MPLAPTNLLLAENAKLHLGHTHKRRQHVEQIPRYIICLHEILAHTPHNHVERRSLYAAQTKLEELSRVSGIGPASLVLSASALGPEPTDTHTHTHTNAPLLCVHSKCTMKSVKRKTFAKIWPSNE